MTPPKVPPYPLGAEHLQAFGSIVQQFARFERLVELTISAILGARYGLVALTVAGLGYNAKCDALLSLLVAVTMDQRLKDGVSTNLKDFNAYLPLRNAIAHHIWHDGVKPHTIKPLSVSARGGKGKVKGLADDEPEYAVDDLYKIANTLVKIHDNFRGFLFAAGFMDGIVAQTAAMNAASSSGDQPSN